MSSVFDQLRGSLGKHVEDAAVIELLERFECKLKKPNDGQQYAINKKLGFDLLFEPEQGIMGGKSKHLRVLTTIFLFPEGKDKHKQFTSLPFNLNFADSIQDVEKKLGTAVKSIPLGAIWHIEDLAICAGGGVTREITIYPWEFYETRFLSR